MRSSPRHSKSLGKVFKDIANVVFEENCKLMKTNLIPAFESLHHKEPLGKYDCSPNLTFTTGGLYNPPHQDEKDTQDFAFSLFLPSNLSDVTLLKSNHLINLI
jgi:hypothetical protein